MTVLTDINRQDGTPELRARARWLYYVLTIVFLSLITRLVFLQIIHGERYTFLSQNNRSRIKRMPRTRGMVVDRQGQHRVDSRASFDLLFVPDDTDDPHNTSRLLATSLAPDDEALLTIP